ncbi:muts domain V-domain-containing protein [Irpex rosettiformis]|uniref:Muts domain V-domain-containing protein n=1 Tax=Irpex rosettiformis TaxID=378272 RepID=A0ACB8TX94_9APHY|nr:muts domain V-domain-containing protein [Irpex rosettiformis]
MPKSPKSGRQSMLSSYFSQSSPTHKQPVTAGQRSSSPIDLTNASDGERPAKRRKKAVDDLANARKLPLQNAGAQSQAPSLHNGLSAINQYRFGTQVPRQSFSAVEERARLRRHEQARRILLSNHNALDHQNSDEHGEYDATEDDVDNDEEQSRSVPSPATTKTAHKEATPDAEGDKFKETMTFFANSSGKHKGSRKKPVATAAPVRAAKKVQEIGPSGEAYTPLELQVRELKNDNPGTFLMFEIGYKIVFYGDDAQIAARLLGIACFRKRNFMTAMIPIHRREVHLKKLLSEGLKVGIVEQTETAALKKAGDTRNELFERRLTNLYTAATYVDQLGSVDDMDPLSAPPLVCLTEEPKGGMGIDEKVSIALISISASTGDVTWDHFEDNHMRTELETRLVHISPSELLLSEDQLTKATTKMLEYFTTHSRFEHKVRTEHIKKPMSYTDAYDFVVGYYTSKAGHSLASSALKTGELTAAVTNFPQQVVIALAHVMRYLASFNVADALLETRFFTKFTERTHMLLNGNTLTNLEIYRNETDFTKRGSLMWILDHTTTRFGARMLKSWVGRPLVDKEALNARVNAVEEILTTQSPKLTVLRQILRGLPDLARGLCRIQYGKCTPQELAILLPAFNKIAIAFDRVPNSGDTGFRSPILNDIIAALPRLKEPVKALLDDISLKDAKEGNKVTMWNDPDKYPSIDEYTMGVQIVESELMDELRKIRKELKRPALQYTAANGEEYLIELKKSEVKEIPPRWRLISGTKYVRRVRSPGIIEKLEQRAQLKEALDREANSAFQSFLAEISDNHYAVLRDAVNKLATADCLQSLALVALQEGYVRPQNSDEDVMEIKDGRHPMIEALRDDPFVPNTIKMHLRHKVITGPNMGGKSSAVRMIALCAIMAQIGSYVPATSMILGMLDGILIRMGASDELARGRSTFMVELQETSDILRLATPRTLVVLDELGRGTSTFDGMAIAGAVLQQLVQNTKCKTLFITHYPEVASDLEKGFPEHVENLHMGYTEETRIDGTREVTFLYKLAPGMATDSFGVECGRLAGLPEEILRRATDEARRMQTIIEKRAKSRR